MMHLTCRCNVKQENLQDVRNHIIKWIHTLESKWEEPKYYEAFQEQKNKKSVIFFISFSNHDNEREMAHIPEARKFGEDLYSMCVEPVLWKEYKNIRTIRNSKQENKVHLLIKYKIRQNKINENINAIHELLENVEKHEGNNTTVYESWQDVDDESSFIHLIQFKNKEAEQNHKNVFYTKKFTELLSLNILQEPEYCYLDLIGSVRR